MIINNLIHKLIMFIVIGGNEHYQGVPTKEKIDEKGWIRPFLIAAGGDGGLQWWTINQHVGPINS